MIDLGDAVIRSVTLTDRVSGAPVDPDSVSVLVTLPDGTTAAPIPTKLNVGVYQFTYVPTQTGLHRFKWLGTGAAAFGQPGTFTVWPETSVIALDEAKDLLTIKESDTDEKIREFIEAATGAITRWCGPLVPTQITSRVRSYSGGYPARAAYDGVQGYSSSLVLPVTPVISLVSITPIGGDPIDLTQVFVAPSGVVDASIAQLYTGRFYDVVYVAGRTSIPGDLHLAVVELLRHLWATQRGSTARPGSAQQTAAQTVPGAAFAFPYRVEQLMQPYVQIGIG